jgi:hypothetical protein
MLECKFARNGGILWNITRQIYQVNPVKLLKSLYPSVQLVLPPDETENTCSLPVCIKCKLRNTAVLVEKRIRQQRSNRKGLYFLWFF